MRTLRLGDKGDAVKNLQRRLNENFFKTDELTVDGDYGKKTEAAVLEYQIWAKILADGVAGPVTLKSLGFVSTRLGWVKVQCDPYGEGYASVRMREDIAVDLQAARDEIKRYGAIFPTSGGRRSLNAANSPTRSAKSFHFVGRAFDFYLYCAMVNPKEDPYVVVEDGDYFRLYARCAKEGEFAEERELRGMKWKDGKVTRNKVKGLFLDVTAVMEKHGFERIRPRKSFPRLRNASEFWHFQNETGMILGVTTFGDELEKVYSQKELVGTNPWNHQRAIFGVDWF